MDLEITSPSDYTLHVTGLDPNYNTKDLKISLKIAVYGIKKPKS